MKIRRDEEGNVYFYCDCCGSCIGVITPEDRKRVQKMIKLFRKKKGEKNENNQIRQS